MSAWLHSPEGLTRTGGLLPKRLPPRTAGEPVQAVSRPCHAGLSAGGLCLRHVAAGFLVVPESEAEVVVSSVTLAQK